MWYPGYGVNQDLKQLILACLDDTEIKNEIAKQVRIEVDNQRKKYNGTIQSYESLTSGNVNMQAKMAASGYDVYGRTVINSNQGSYNNKNAYRKMKNQIKYGRSPQNGYDNRGSFNTI